MTHSEADEALLARHAHILGVYRLALDLDADDGKPAMLPPNSGPVDKQALTRLLREVADHEAR